LFVLTLAMTVYLPVWHWHCTRVRFTVLVLCSETSDEFAIHSACPLLCLQRHGCETCERIVLLLVFIA